MSDQRSSREKPAAADGASTQGRSSPTTAAGSTFALPPSALGPSHAPPMPAPVVGYAAWAPRAVAGLLDRLPARLAAALLVSGYLQSLLAAGRARSLGPEWSAGEDLLTAGLIALLGAVV